MTSIIEKIIFQVLSYSPIFSITNDKMFGKNDKNLFKNNSNETKCFRISFIQIPLGVYKVYICTYLKNETERNFKLIDLIKLDEIVYNRTYIEKIEELTKNYEMHYSSLDEKTKKIELDFIKYKISIENQRSERADFKMNLWTSIFLVMIPLILNYINLKKISNITGIILFAFLILFGINVVIYIFCYQQVKSINLSTVKELKESDNKETQAANNYYFDWQNFSRKSQISLSYVQNIQGWIISIIIICIVFALGTFNNSPEKNKSCNMVYTINTANLDDKNSDDRNTLLKINNSIIQDNIDSITIIYSKEINEEGLNKINNHFDIYQDIKKKLIVDEEFNDKDKIKIIVEGD